MAEKRKDIYTRFKNDHKSFDISVVDITQNKILHIDHKGKEYKYCSKCDKWQTIDYYPSSTNNWDGLDRICKECKYEKSKVITKVWKEKNKDHVEEYRKKYEDDHIEQRKEYNRLTDSEKEKNEIKHKKTYYKMFEKSVKEKDGTVISNWSDYEDAHTKLWIKCANGHHFDITSSNLKLNKWCPVCSKSTKGKKCSLCEKTFSVDYFNKKKKDGKQIYQDKCRPCSNKSSKEYKQKNADKVSEYNKKYREVNKEQVQAYYKVSDEQKELNNKERKQKYYDRFKELVEQRGGVCLSKEEEYDTAHVKLRVKCQDSHEFQISLNNLAKRRWCPHCCIFYGEEYSRYAMQHLFDCEFKKQRPAWLTNEKGNRLELDGFNENEAVAFEFNGLQHYEEVDYFFKSKKDFEKRLVDDEIKKKKCEEKGICLVIIPYDIEMEKIPKFIFDECKKQGREIEKFRLDNFDVNDYNTCCNKLEQIKKLIKDKNGHYISGIYINRSSQISIQCNKGHEFSSCSRNLKRGIWCPTCGLEVNDKTAEKISSTMKEYFASDKGKKQKIDAHAKRSITMAQQRIEARKELTHVTCAKCNINKEVTEFCKKSASKTGYQSWCKPCINIKKQQVRQEQK